MSEEIENIKNILGISERGKCEACRIENEHKLVKNMPVHTCTEEYEKSNKELLNSTMSQEETKEQKFIKENLHKDSDQILREYADLARKEEQDRVKKELNEEFKKHGAGHTVFEIIERVMSNQ
jgi:hypothetical protein